MNNKYVKLYKLRKLRERNHFTIYDMAKLLNITPSFYSQIENGKRRLFYNVAVQISNIFNITPNEIFYDDFS